MPARSGRYPGLPRRSPRPGAWHPRRRLRPGRGPCTSSGRPGRIRPPPRGRSRPPRPPLLAGSRAWAPPPGRSIDLDHLTILAVDEVGQRLQADRQADRPDAAVAEDEQADAGVRAAEAAVGQRPILVLRRAERPLVRGVVDLDPGHPALGVV